MSKPAIGKKVSRLIESSGNRHKAGANRVKIELKVTLTCEPEEAEAIAQVLAEGGDGEFLPEELQELLAYMRAIDPKLVKKSTQISKELKFAAYGAKLTNWDRQRQWGIDVELPDSPF